MQNLDNIITQIYFYTKIQYKHRKRKEFMYTKVFFIKFKPVHIFYTFQSHVQQVNYQQTIL